MKKKLLTSLMVASITLLLGACTSSNTSSSSDVNIVTTFYPVYEFTKEIAGDTANVTMLMDAGTEPHDYEPSAKDIATIEDADAFVYMSDYMETWVPDLNTNLKDSNVSVIDGTADMILLPGTEEEDHDETEAGHTHEYDPHVWLSPYRAIMVVEHIRDELKEQYPKLADTFEKNAEAYITKLEALDKKYSETLADAKQKSFVTQHAAFNYLATDYGLTQVAITGLTADEDISATRLAELTDYIKKYDIKYIYFEETASSSVSETLASETGAQAEVLSPIEGITDEEISKGETYLTVMEENLEALKLTIDQSGTTIEPENGEESTKTVYNGYFNDSDIQDRTLSDYVGDWQSVYPLLLDGSLDQVFDYKSKASGATMTAEEYKSYYETGYKTDVENIKITDKTITFTVNGEEKTYTYEYKGYKILNYSKGNRGVRYLFEATDSDAGDYKYVQFSDHNITSTQSSHFHIFFGGESQDKLLEELENWPTYYPSDMSAHDIAQEMVSH